MEETKRCPYCGEEILAVAKKCKHCGEWLEPQKPEREKRPCPICGEMVDENLAVCPYCNEPTHFDDSHDNTNEIGHTNNKTNVERDKTEPTPSVDTITTRNNFLHKFGGVALYFLIGCVAFGCLYGIKQCRKQRRQETFQSIKNPLAEKFKKSRDEAFAKLTKSPWYGKNAISETDIEDGWIAKVDAVVDSKKIYTNDNKYKEKGTMTIEFTCSHSDLIWKAEGVIQFRENGEFWIYSDTDFNETTKNFYGTIIDTKVKLNSTTIDDENIAMNLRLRLNDIIKEANNSNENTHYMIKTLTDNILQLDEMEKESLKSTGTILTYKRD